MSERAFFLIPSDPFYLPDEGRRVLFLKFFTEVSPLPNANGSYYCYVWDEPQPVGLGEGSEAVICPACGTQLRFDDDSGGTSHYDWLMAALTKPRDAEVQTPCCGATGRVADLRLYADGAFARFAVGALEPSDSDYWEEESRPFRLKRETLERFEEILGCSVLQIWDYR
jgi:hypothetical protein